MKVTRLASALLTRGPRKGVLVVVRSLPKPLLDAYLRQMMGVKVISGM